jgi:hypothetical protein
LGSSVERVAWQGDPAQRTLEVTGVAAQNEFPTVIRPYQQRLMARSVSRRREQGHPSIAKDIVFTVQKMRHAIAIDVRGQVVLAVDVRECRQPFGPLNHQFRSGQDATASPVVKVKMTQREDIDVVGTDATRLEPLDEIRTFWQKSVERGSDGEVPRGLRIPEVRMQTGVEDERRTFVFNKVGRDRKSDPPLLSFN